MRSPHMHTSVPMRTRFDRRATSSINAARVRAWVCIEKMCSCHVYAVDRRLADSVRNTQTPHSGRQSLSEKIATFIYRTLCITVFSIFYLNRVSGCHHWVCGISRRSSWTNNGMGDRKKHRGQCENKTIQNTRARASTPALRAPIKRTVVGIAVVAASLSHKSAHFALLARTHAHTPFYTATRIHVCVHVFFVGFLTICTLASVDAVCALVFCSVGRVGFFPMPLTFASLHWAATQLQRNSFGRLLARWFRSGRTGFACVSGALSISRTRRHGIKFAVARAGCV